MRPRFALSIASGEGAIAYSVKAQRRVVARSPGATVIAQLPVLISSSISETVTDGASGADRAHLAAVGAATTADITTAAITTQADATGRHREIDRTPAINSGRLPPHSMFRLCWVLMIGSSPRAGCYRVIGACR